MGRKRKPLVRPDEPSQQTKRGLEIPVPEREDFFGTLRRVSKKRPAGPARREKAEG